MTAPGLQLELLLSTARAQRQLQQDMTAAARRSGVAANDAFGQAFRPKNLIGAALPVAASAVAARGIGLIVNSAQEMNQALGATTQIYGEMSEELNNWVQENSRGLGLAKKDAQDYVNQFSSILIGLEIGQGQAAKFSQQLIQAGAALAAFRNTSVEQAIGALQAGFRGEYDSLQRFIPQVSDLTLRNKSMALGLAESKTAVTQQDKALALLDIVQKSVANSAGKAELESGNLQTRMNTLKAASIDAAANIGAKLLPSLEKTVDVITAIGPANVVAVGGLLLLARSLAGVGNAGVAAASVNAVTASTRLAAVATIQYNAAVAQAAVAGGAQRVVLLQQAALNLQVAQAASANAAAQTGLAASITRLTLAMSAAGGAGARMGVLVSSGINSITAATAANPATAIILIATASLAAAEAGNRLQEAGYDKWGATLKGLTGISPLVLKLMGSLTDSVKVNSTATDDATKLGQDLADVYVKEGEAAALAAAATKVLQNVDLSERADQYIALGYSVNDYNKALSGSASAQTKVNDSFNTSIAKVQAMSEAEKVAAFGSVKAADEHVRSLESNRDAVNRTADAERKRVDVLGDVKAEVEGLSEEQTDLIGNLAAVGDTTLTTAERAKALKDVYKQLYDETINANEANEAFIESQVSLGKVLKDGGANFDLAKAKTDEAKTATLENRDALEEALTATRDIALADLERGQTLEQVNATHQKNIETILKAIPASERNSAAVQQLVNQYGAIPTDVKSTFTAQDNGVRQVFKDILKDVEYLLKNGFLPPKALSQMTPAERAAVGGNRNGGLWTGGRVHGPGGPIDDKAGLFALSDKEFVLRAHAVNKLDQALGPGGLEHMNETGQVPVMGAMAVGGRPGQQSPGKLPFARPGIQPPSLMDSDLRFAFEKTQAAVIKRLVMETAAKKAAAQAGNWNGTIAPGAIGAMQQWALSKQGGQYLWAGVGPGGMDCSGMVGNLWAIATGNPLYRRYFTTQNMGPGRFGMDPGPGNFTVYLHQGGAGGGHTAANVGGLHVEAYGGNGTPYAIGHVGTRLSYYDQVMHLRGMAEGGRVFNRADPGSNPKEQLESFFQRGWPEPPPRIVRQSEMPELHRSYDRGGKLYPGDTGTNYGTRPEAVLDANQTERFEALTSGESAFHLSDFTIAKIAQALRSQPVVIQLDGREVARAAFDRGNF
jgi:hypothetical protein